MSIALKGVTHAYGRNPPVLDEISLDVERGDIVAVTGASGSGKTTLLSIMGLLQAPTVGEVLVDGSPAPSRGAALQRLRSSYFAWVFQTVNVLGRRTALDNVVIGLLARGYTRLLAEKEGRIALERVGLGEFWNHPVQDLSGGELQRVCIARALAGDPQVLLADEPTGQLDRSTSLRVMGALMDALPQSTAVVVASHDPVVAERCRRILELRDGSLVEA